MTLAEKLVIKNIDTFASAIKVKSGAGSGLNKKLEFYGVSNLRKLILDLAVRGVLVPQDPKEERADALLNRISKEKDKLIQQGLIRKKKSLPILRPDQIPFQIPPSWVWQQLDDITSVLGDGIHGTPSYESNGEYYFINGNNLNHGKIEIKSETKKVSYLEYEKHKKNLNETTILVSINGSIGKVALFNNEKIMLGKSACYFNLLGSINRSYIMELIRTEYFLKYAFQKATGSTIKNVSLKTMREFPVPLPPIEEQRRIVAKVNELMGICDKLELNQENCFKKHETLVSTILDEMISKSEDVIPLAKSWQCIQENFDILFTTESSIEQLKQLILQLAVMGKLVPQDPEDESAKQLLSKITEIKSNMVKEGKIKKQKELPNISKDEIKRVIPRNWEYCRLNDLIQISSGQGLTSANMAKNGQIPVYGGNGVSGHHDKANVFKRTLTIGRVGYYCGAIHITPEKAWVTDNAFITIFPEEYISLEFLAWLLRATDLKENQNATAQPVISGKKLYPIVVSLPPLAEQRRIVAKVDELMALCDQLKSKLATAQTTQNKLASSLVADAIK